MGPDFILGCVVHIYTERTKHEAVASRFIFNEVWVKQCINKVMVCNENCEKGSMVLIFCISFVTIVTYPVIHSIDIILTVSYHKDDGMFYRVMIKCFPFFISRANIYPLCICSMFWIDCFDRFTLTKVCTMWYKLSSKRWSKEPTRNFDWNIGYSVL